MLSLTDIFEAYYDCRRHKRNTYGTLEFELHYELECIKLWKEIESRTYTLRPCTAFIVRDPVQREIFASHFRDRVIHHLIARRLEPILEKILIHDVYNSRKGKGTHYGIQRIDHFMRSCSENYQKNAYILKLDISWFFMSIDRSLLWQKIQDLICRPEIQEDEQDIFCYLIRIIIFSDPKKWMKICGQRTDWIGLPKSKSLFCAEYWKWLPIGNLTSQIFSNIYMHEFDVFIKKILRIRYYGRYVDDFILIHRDREYLKSCIMKIRIFLAEKLELKLHPKKIYLQHFSKWALFLGTYIKPWRKYVGRRTKGNFYKCIDSINRRWKNPDPLSDKENIHILAQVNSYLGLMWHSDSYRFREKMIGILDERFWEYFSIGQDFKKIIQKS